MNGKEDACIDVQHKKRGRPRLRDERDTRYESVGTNFPPPPLNPLFGRPLSMYAPNEMMGPTSMPISQRSPPYQILKSQSGANLGQRYPEHGPMESAYFPSQLPPTPRTAGLQDIPCAYLSMDLVLMKVSTTFGESVGARPLVGRTLHEIVVPNDREKVLQIHRMLSKERQDRHHPTYLPSFSMLDKNEAARVIHSVDINIEELRRAEVDRHQELLTFQSYDGQQRPYQVRIGLSMRDQVDFVVLLLVPQMSMQPYRHPISSPPYSAQYGFPSAATQTWSQTPVTSPYASYQPAYGDTRNDPVLGYRQQSGIANSSSAMQPTALTYAQPPGRQEYGQVPRSELPPAPMQRQHELQLPPIRSQQSMEAGAQQRPPDRTGRVDIGGLLDTPESFQRRT